MMSGRPLLLKAESIEANYGPVRVLSGLAIRISENQVIGIRGKNGSGKSTLLKVIAGSVPNHGTPIEFRGRPIDHLPIHERSRAGICLAPQYRAVFPGLSVFENLAVVRQAQLDSKKFHQRLGTITEVFPSFDLFNTQLAGSLSGGEQQMLSLLRTMVLDPKLLLLDEPIRGIAEASKEAVATYIAAFARRPGRAVVVVFHEKVPHFQPDIVYTLERGRQLTAT